MSSEITKIGLIGCGNISPQYFKGAKLYDNIEIVACSDIAPEVAKARAEEFGVPRALTVDALIQDEEIDIVLNLTTPQFHAPVNMRVLEAGKHAYCEKPFSTNREEGKEALALAEKKGLYIGCAPDTFMSAPLQTARKLIDEGFIGTPIGANVFYASPGHESWHPNPEFYYKKGGGPLLDMGPYYLTTLANFFGPVKSVAASSSQGFDERTIGSEPLKGTKISVETPTHYSGILGFENGATANMLFSFDLKGKHDVPIMTIFGTEGTLSIPDANFFPGTLRVSRVDAMDWQEVPVQHHYEGARAIGLADMAAAIREKRPQRANGELAYHIFDVMTAFDESHDSGTRIPINTRFNRLPVIGASKDSQPQF